MLRTSVAFLLVALAGSTAHAALGVADLSDIRTLDGTRVTSSGAVTLRGAAIPFNVYTGIAAGSSLVLLEPTAPPVRDDVVTLGTANEAINDYIAAAGSVQRFVTSSVQLDVTPGVDLITITVSGRDAAGAPADLWPSGFTTTTGAPITNGGFAIGINLPAALGGTVPLNLAPDNALQGATLQWVTDGVLGPELNLPAGFFSPALWNWNGTIGLTWGNGATGNFVQSDITLRLFIPAPASGALLGMSGLVAFRRRRA